jgi:hypothetical protein
MAGEMTAKSQFIVAGRGYGLNCMVLLAKRVELSAGPFIF